MNAYNSYSKNNKIIEIDAITAVIADHFSDTVSMHLMKKGGSYIDAIMFLSYIAEDFFVKHTYNDWSSGEFERNSMVIEFAQNSVNKLLSK